MKTILKDCKKAEIYMPGGQKLTARVRLTERQILLYLVEYDGTGEETGVRVDFYDGFLGVVRTECGIRVLERADPEDRTEKWLGTCDIWRVLETKQRHQDVRADMRVPMKFRSERTGPFDGMIVNISAGGALIRCPISLEKGECVAFQYAFRKRILPFTLKVLYQRDEHDETEEEKKEKKEKAFFYGCRFVHISPGAEADVRGFVFHKQREDIHRGSDEPAE